MPSDEDPLIWLAMFTIERTFCYWVLSVMLAGNGRQKSLTFSKSPGVETLHGKQEGT